MFAFTTTVFLKTVKFTEKNILWRHLWKSLYLFWVWERRAGAWLGRPRSTRWLSSTRSLRWCGRRWAGSRCPRPDTGPGQLRRTSSDPPETKKSNKVYQEFGLIGHSNNTWHFFGTFMTALMWHFIISLNFEINIIECAF